jgi:ABC-type transport system involved in multi-copper enzyme maturation permease subunit
MPLPPPLVWGPGPVFVYESIAATRRWQLYALRSLFVLGLLVGLSLAWFVVRTGFGEPGANLPIKQLASLGKSFYLANATAQLTLVLLVAPAATAGTIRQARAQGNLTHMFVTDLTDSEIVLGKLAARLVPVLALVAATVPVLALAGLLGGVIIEAILALTLITLVLAFFGSALALAISVRATRMHEVLMAVYGIEAAWVMGPMVWELLAGPGVFPQAPGWFKAINPFVLAWSPYAWPQYHSTERLSAVLGGTLALSSGLVAYAVLRLRAEVTSRSGSRPARLAAWLRTTRARLSAWCPSPSLDENPILWREWRRGRPSRLARVLWSLFLVASFAATLWGVLALSVDYEKGERFLAMGNGLQATFGLLLVSLTAPTVLAEERVRGSLDVLMTTPLSSARIVLAKWWGAYRVVLALAILPAVGAFWLAMEAPRFPSVYGRASPAPFSQHPAPLAALDRIADACFPVAMLLVQGAAVTSVGLALATGIHRLGRAVAASVTCYALFAFGWLVLLEVGIVTGPLSWIGLISPADHEAEQFFAQLLAGACPLGGQYFVFETIHFPAAGKRSAFYIGEIVVLLATLVFAILVLGLTLAMFNRCMGRMPERPRRAPRPPRSVAGLHRPHLRAADAMQRSESPCPL